MVQPTRSKEFWDMLEVSRLRGLFLQGDMTIEKIASTMGRSKTSVERKLRRLNLRRSEEQVRKYTDDFRETVIAYYYATNRKETAEKFGISDKVIEGFITRRNKRLKLTNKIDKKNEWTHQETITMLQYIGLKPLAFIADKLGKTEPSVRSYIRRKGYRLRYVNGLPRDIFESLFVRTKEIPFMRNVEGEVFIPWTTFEDNIHTVTNGDEFQMLIVRSMAKFQRFLQGAKNNQEIRDILWLKIEE